VSSPTVPERAARSSASLADLTTLRVGGPAARLVEVTTEQSLLDEVARCDDAGEPVLVLGGGSNVVIADAGFDGTVVGVRTRGVRVDSDACSGASVTVAAGEPWEPLVERAVTEGWVGIEALSGIPGLVGATPIQNVGAYGQEVADVIASVRTYDRAERRIVTLAAADCEFAYRSSRLKIERHAGGSRFVVLSVTFQLPLGDLSAPLRYAELARALDAPVGARRLLADVRAAVLALRTAKGMVLDADDHDTWSAGSFFTNPILTSEAYERLARVTADELGPAAVPPAFPAGPGLVKTSAAWLIERAGFVRGYGHGAARLSTKHSLAVTNRGGARAVDLLALADEIRQGVFRQFGVELSNEPELVGLSLPPLGEPAEVS
jgi:UDP-N-acetylmuramate dehydrogenase